MKSIRFRSIDNIMKFFHGISLNKEGYLYVYRGQANEKWPLMSSYHRMSNVKLREHFDYGITEITNRFIEKIIRSGNKEALRFNRRGKLEYARHAGVPSTLIDFTYSPYIALWFAFNGVSKYDDDNVAIYVLNFDNAVHSFGKYIDDKSGTRGLSTKFYDEASLNKFFEESYPVFPLMMKNSASWNTRMHRQQGCFLYDGNIYKDTSFQNIEDFVYSDILPINSEEILYKVLIPKKLKSDIMRYLALMGITGEYLLGGEAGIVLDVINGEHTLHRSRAWDL